MQPSALQNVITHLRKLTDPARGKDLSDADLLERFRIRHEEAAFTLLVQRHGPMVHGICRRVLGDAHDAEDAFQATFLVLVRNASAIRKRQSLASWLHGVASRIAHKTRARSTRQRTRERQVLPPGPHADPFETLAVKELRAALDEEIERLPDKYRTPLVLCYLAEKTHEQAAGELGWPKSSLTARLTRARQLLQRRLTRRGFTVPAGLLAALLTETTTNAAIPALLTLSTVRLAVQTVRGETIAATTTTVLADGFLKGVAVGKWTAALTLLATIGLAAVVGHRLSSINAPPKNEEPAAKAQALGDRHQPKAEAPKPRVDQFGDPLPDGVVARIGSSRMRHPRGCHTLAFSPDGKSIVSSGDGLLVWDTATGKLLRRFDFGKMINNMPFYFTAEGIVCAAVDDKGIVTIRVLDPATGKARRQLHLDEAADGLNPALSPDGKHLAIAAKNVLQLYDVGTGAKTVRIPVKGLVAWDIAFTPNGKIVAFNDLSTDAIYLHDTATGKLVRELKQAGAATLHLVFSPAGRFLASMPQNRLTEKGEVSIWNWREGKEVHRLTHPFRLAVSAAFSPDGRRVAIGGGRWGLVLWDVETGKEVRRLSPQGGVSAIAFSPDGKTLATASPRGAIRQWDAATGKLLPASADADVQNVRNLRFSSDGKRLFGDAGACLIWDATSGRELRRIADPEAFDFKLPNDSRVFTLSPDESLLATANLDRTIGLCDAVTGKERHRLKGHKLSVYDIRFTPDSRRLISSSGGGEGTVRVWDVKSGRELHSMTGLMALTVSPDGYLLAVAIGTTPEIVIYELANGREKKRVSLAAQGNVLQMAFSPDSRRLAAAGSPCRSGGGGIAKVWDVADGQLLRSLDSPKTVLWSVAFSPDGRSVATGDAFGALLLWELASGRPRHSFIGHQSRTYSLAFSPDGRTLAASSVEAPVYVWDVAGTLEPRPRRLPNEELQCHWTALAGEDAPAAFEAIRRLAAAPKQTLPFLRERLKPVPAPDLPRVRQLVKALDSDVFAERQKAAAELAKHADAAASLLRQTIKDKPSLYVRRTLQQILESLETTPETLRAVRAVEVLESITTPDAVRLIDEMAKGTADARLTREADAARKSPAPSWQGQTRSPQVGVPRWRCGGVALWHSDNLAVDPAT